MNFKTAFVEIPHLAGWISEIEHQVEETIGVDLQLTDPLLTVSSSHFVFASQQCQIEQLKKSLAQIQCDLEAVRGSMAAETWDYLADGFDGDIPLKQFLSSCHRLVTLPTTMIEAITHNRPLDGRFKPSADPRAPLVFVSSSGTSYRTPASFLNFLKANRPNPSSPVPPTAGGTKSGTTYGDPKCKQ